MFLELCGLYNLHLTCYNVEQKVVTKHLVGNLVCTNVLSKCCIFCCMLHYQHLCHCFWFIQFCCLKCVM